MNKIITTEETDIELDPESLTDNVDIAKSIFDNKTKMLEAIRDLDNIIENNIDLKQNISIPTSTHTEDNNRYSCFIRIKSRNTNNEFNMNFRLIGLNQGIIERNISDIEIEASEQKLIKFFTFYQNNVTIKRRSKKTNNRYKQLKLLLYKNNVASSRKRRKVINKNDVYVMNLNVNFNGKKIKLIDSNESLWRISEMSYKFENNRSTCRVSLTRTH